MVFPADGTTSCFHFLVIMNNSVAWNVGEQISLSSVALSPLHSVTVVVC